MGILRFCQTGHVQKIGTFTKICYTYESQFQDTQCSTISASKSGTRSFLLLRKDWTVSHLFNNGPLRMEKLVVFRRNNSGNYHILLPKKFSLIHLEKVYEQTKDKEVAQTTRGSWTTEVGFILTST